MWGEHYSELQTVSVNRKTLKQFGNLLFLFGGHKGPNVWLGGGSACPSESPLYWIKHTCISSP